MIIAEERFPRLYFGMCSCVRITFGSPMHHVQTELAGLLPHPYYTSVSTHAFGSLSAQPRDHVQLAVVGLLVYTSSSSRGFGSLSAHNFFYALQFAKVTNGNRRLQFAHCEVMPLLLHAESKHTRRCTTFKSYLL